MEDLPGQARPAAGDSACPQTRLTTRFAVGQSRPVPLPSTKFPATISRTELPARRRGFDLDIHSGGQRQLVQSVDRLAGRLDDVDQPFMRADFKLLPRLLIDVRAAQHRVTLNPGWKRYRTMNDRAGPLGRIDNFRRRLIEYGMIVGFHADADAFLFFPSHSQFPSHTTS